MFTYKNVQNVFSGDIASGWERKAEYIKYIQGDDNEMFCLVDKHLLTRIEDSEQSLELLEVGCGTGKLLNQLCSKYYSSVNFTGIELSQDMAAQVQKKKFRKAVTLLTQPVECYKGETNFDVIILKQVLHHAKSRKDLLEKLDNMMTTRGGIFLMIPNENYQNSIIPYGGESDCLGRMSEALLRRYICNTSLIIVDKKRTSSSCVFRNIYDYFMFLYSIGSFQKLFNYKPDYSHAFEFINLFKPTLQNTNELKVCFDYSYYVLQKKL